MRMSPLIILVLLLAVLVLALLAVREYIKGVEQKRMLASRSALEHAERRANSFTARLDRGLRRTDFGKAIDKRLAAAGVNIGLGTFVVALSMTGVVAIVVVGQVLALPLGLLAAALVGWGFFRYLRSQQERRREAFIAQLPDVARVLSNATGAGLALRTAIGVAGEELDEPAKSELSLTAEGLKVGQPMDDALGELEERLPSREIGVLVNTLLVSERAGGSLVTALRNIAATLEQRKELRREIKTTLAQSVYTGYMVVLLGVGILFMMDRMSPGVVEQMTQSFIGVAILAVSGTLFAVGLALVRRTTRIDA